MAGSSAPRLPHGAEIASVLWDVFGNPVAHQVTFGAGPASRRRNRVSGLSVYAPGDPAPTLWPELVVSFRNDVLSSLDTTTDALLAGVKVTVVGLDQIWLEFATAGARGSLGRLPGAATGLNDRLTVWNGGVTALCCVAAQA